jgi:hypothetical protein
MQHFSRWGQVKIAKVSYLLDAFLYGWSDFSPLRMLSRMFKGSMPLVGHMERIRKVRLMVRWLSRRDINLRCNLHMLEAVIISLISVSKPHILSL